MPKTDETAQRKLLVDERQKFVELIASVKCHVFGVEKIKATPDGG